MSDTNDNNGFPDGLPDIQATPLSDDYLALEFVRAYGEQFRWTPGMDWMLRAGTYWVPDAKKQRFARARTICRIASTKSRDGDLARKISGASTISNTLRVAQTDERIVVAADGWNANPVLLNTPAGVFDLHTGERRDHGPDDLFTYQTPVAPDFVKKPERFLRFLREVFQDDQALITYVQRVLGYSMTGLHHIHDIYVWWGKLARNGKNTLADLIVYLMGDLAVVLPTLYLLNSGANKHRQGLARLHGKRFSLSSEADPSDWFNETLLKDLSGNEFFTANYMRCNDFTFTLTQKLHLLANRLPKLHGGDRGLRERMRVIPFDAVFYDANDPDRPKDGLVRDLNLPRQLREEAGAVLTWLLEGAFFFLRDGLPALPQRVYDASKDYMDSNDDIALWIADCCIQGDAYTGMGEPLYASYKFWKEARQEVVPSSNTWSSMVLSVPGISKKRFTDGYRYRGIGLRPRQLYAATA